MYRILRVSEDKIDSPVQNMKVDSYNIRMGISFCYGQ
jgi:hypothetical protein